MTAPVKLLKLKGNAPGGAAVIVQADPLVGQEKVDSAKDEKENEGRDKHRA